MTNFIPPGLILKECNVQRPINFFFGLFVCLLQYPLGKRINFEFLNNQHRVSITEETIFIFYCLFISIHNQIITREGASHY